jgi:type 1 fimbria pilin
MVRPDEFAVLCCRIGNVFQRANITFSGAPDRDNPDYLSVQSETENLAIEIYDSKGPNKP